MTIRIDHMPAESHMAFVLKSGGVFRVYLNGDLVPTLTLTDEEVGGAILPKASTLS